MKFKGIFVVCITHAFIVSLVPLFSTTESFANTKTMPTGYSIKETIYGMGDRRQRRENFHQLREMGDAATDALLEVLGESDVKTSVKVACVQLLREIKSPASVDVLKDTSRDQAVRLRLESVRALGAIGGDQVEETLLQSITDPAYQVRIAAIEGLQSFTGENVTDALIARLSDDDDEVLLKAIHALGKSKRVEAVEPLIEKLQHTRPVIVATTIDNLAFIGDLRAVEPIIEKTKSIGKAVRLHAVRALGALKDDRAVPRLIDMLDDEITNVKNAARESLKAITGKDFGYDKLAWKQDA